jgi:hypothetical protein
MRYICVDFDGTCVTHEFPSIGKDIGAIPVLKALINEGHKLILFTMRGEDHLAAAVKWFEDHDLDLYGINTNPTQKHWTDSPKAYGHIYIDDAALGCPLLFDTKISNRPFVDWDGVEDILRDGIFLPA